MLIADQVATNIKYSKHNTFANANKPGRWLAYQLRKRQKARLISKVLIKGCETYQQQVIKKAFTEFYTQLYSPGDTRMEDIESYLQSSPVYKLTTDQQKWMNEEITVEEIEESIKQLKTGKSPGTDGLTAIYYKVLSVDMIQPLKILFNSIMEGGPIPQSWTRAFISLIPKEDKDTLELKDYRPISLLNVDYKIFAKILANRLMRVLQHYIHHDQTGFISGRYMKNNVRQIINLLEYLDKNNQVPSAFIFLDAEKAFDKLDWKFLHKLLEHMNFGDHFTLAIKAIYHKQCAQIIVNGDLTDPIQIQKGTRQGCPLSPLLFILSLEILLNRIRDSPMVKGLKILGKEYKLKAFADDLVFTLAQPAGSLEFLLQILHNYGKVAGLKINANKTKILAKNLTVRDKNQLTQISGFEVVNKVKYLGIFLSCSNVKLYQNNYERLWKTIQKDLIAWKKLQLSLLGRIAAVKMNILPKFLFLFQMIPVLKNDMNLKEWQRDLNRFIWEGKKARVKFKIIQDIRERGGLKAPNLTLYYDACALTWVIDWINLTNKDVLNIEGWDLYFGWHAYLFLQKKIDKTFKNHIIRASLMRVWQKYFFKFDIKLPLWVIPSHVFQAMNRGVVVQGFTYKELLYQSGGGKWTLKSMEVLKQSNPNLSWLMYRQFQDRWRIDQKTNFMLEDGSFLKQVKDGDKGHIKRIYNVLLELDSETELVKDCMIKWGQNIGEAIPMDTWELIWVRNVKFTQAQNLRENFYKMFYRWHLDPSTMSRIYMNYNSKCWRCGHPDATFYHMWWTCRVIKAFWVSIWWNLQQIFKKRIAFLPQLFLLGIVQNLDVRETNLMLYCLSAARLLIAQNWKSPILPTMADWRLKVSNLAEMAKISAYLKDHSNEQFLLIWRRWIIYIQKKHSLKEYKLGC